MTLLYNKRVSLVRDVMLVVILTTTGDHLCPQSLASTTLQRFSYIKNNNA